MICYAANGPKIRFYAIDGSPKQPTPFVPLTDEINITQFDGRFRVLLTTINIARILMTIKDILPTVTYPLGKKLKLGDSELTFSFETVKKTVPVTKLPYSQANAKRRLDFLRQMYAHADHHRGLVHVEDLPRFNRNKTHYVVTLRTKGYANRPREEDRLRAMTKDLVLGIARLNDGGYLHRDIRSPNIIYDPTRQQYVLIDFEHGGKTRSKWGNATKYVVDDHDWLKEWDDGTLDDGVYTACSEMYQLGKLLRNEFGGIILSDLGQDFVMKLKRQRMTAQESLEHGWIRDVP